MRHPNPEVTELVMSITHGRHKTKLKAKYDLKNSNKPQDVYCDAITFARVMMGDVKIQNTHLATDNTIQITDRELKTKKYLKY